MTFQMGDDCGGRMIQKRLLRTVRHPMVNPCARLIWRTLRRLFPEHVGREWLPVTGRYSVSVPGLPGPLKLTSATGDAFAQRLYWDGFESHEPFEMHVFRALAGNCEVIMDVGANIGLFGLVAALDNPAADVYGFEPVPGTFESLCLHRRLNKVDNFHPYCLALSDIDGRLPIYLPPGCLDSPVDASLNPDFRSGSTEMMTNVARLDTLVRQSKCRPPNLMKIDTESTEACVISGGRRTIAASRPSILVEVLSRSAGKALDSVLHALDYRFFELQDNALVERGYPKEGGADRWHNYLFVSSANWADVRGQLAGKIQRINEL